MTKSIKFIAAIDDEYGIAKQGRMPWDLPSDRKFFRESIASAPGLMGWKTFADNHKKPFATCPRNIVITHKDVAFDGVEIIHNLRDFIKDFEGDLWVIGGGDVFAQLLPYATNLYITRVFGDYECDTFFPDFEDVFNLVEERPLQQENDIHYQVQVWRTKRG